MGKGGVRPGAGRKAGEPKSVLRVRVSEAEKMRLSILGDGDASAGLRKLVEVGMVPGTALPQSSAPQGHQPKAFTHGPPIQVAPPSGDKCKSPWKCGRGQAACLPCQEAEREAGK
jgi:hypothetical protein